MDKNDASERADCSERPLPPLLARLDELPLLPLPLALEREPKLHPALADTKDAVRSVCPCARLLAAADTNESVRNACPCRAYAQRSSASAPLALGVPNHSRMTHRAHPLLLHSPLKQSTFAARQGGINLRF